MLQDERSLFNLFGFMIWGDFGPFTMYRSKRGKIVVFLKTWPDKPPSERQEQIRTAFKQGTAAWNELSQAQQEQWHLATTRLSLPLHGYDLFMHWKLQPDDSFVRTIQRQSNTALIE